MRVRGRYSRAELDSLDREMVRKFAAREELARRACPDATRLAIALRPFCESAHGELWHLIRAAWEACEAAKDLGADLTYEAATDVVQVIQFATEAA